MIIIDFPHPLTFMKLKKVVNLIGQWGKILVTVLGFTHAFGPDRLRKMLITIAHKNLERYLMHHERLTMRTARATTAHAMTA